MKMDPPYPVRLSAADDDEEYYVIQPDISAICDESKLDDKGCKGAPDLIVEVLSPSTWQRDRIEKLNLYQKHGVKEYLLIYPNENVVEQYNLDDNGVFATPLVLGEEDTLCTHTFPEFQIELRSIFS
ncbi:Uma2 family endonuclease [Bacillus sp. V33-4]|uniref:Uma2 family endonuclease n=1 Tax=Bacillus sp. V33-4 TaxID=2054169 RepID=UPI000C765110|nr:Uma2 family endonuclease [Bacillus sp. V33-4]PLR87829.1 hypothetical protein CVD23_01240 [Bacillus sp. V33-4]